MPEQIRFDDGAAYDRYMGVWSRLVGESFLDWLAPPPDLKWLDVGCGNGAFTMLLAERCAPAMIHGIDPSGAQLAFARTHVPSTIARFERGDAMALPFGDDSMDAVVMPLVIFFVPDPPVGVAEMARVVRPGGIVAAYAWDVTGGGFPYAVVKEALVGIGVETPREPSPDASRIERMGELWADAGLGDVATREITVRRTFAGFDDYWDTIIGGPSAGRQLLALSPEDRARVQCALRERLGGRGRAGPVQRERAGERGAGSGEGLASARARELTLNAVRVEQVSWSRSPPTVAVEARLLFGCDHGFAFNARSVIHLGRRLMLPRASA